MSPILYQVLQPEGSSFAINDRDHASHLARLHYHPEYQVSLIVAGTGTCTIGATMDTFTSGDVYAIGPNIPHAFRSDAGQERTGFRMISIFFREHSLGRDFFRLPEMDVLQAFMDASARGIKLGQAAASQVSRDIEDLLAVAGADRIIQLLTILNRLAMSRRKEYLSAFPYQFSTRSSIYQRLNNIQQYIAENFDRDISLEEVAKVANLSKYAFCKYFKQCTQKTFVDYLNEFRIRFACRLLRKTQYSISQISLLSGFNNLSHFNRQFKRIMQCTPSVYREEQWRMVGLDIQ